MAFILGFLSAIGGGRWTSLSCSTAGLVGFSLAMSPAFNYLSKEMWQLTIKGIISLVSRSTINARYMSTVNQSNDSLSTKSLTRDMSINRCLTYLPSIENELNWMPKSCIIKSSSFTTLEAAIDWDMTATSRHTMIRKRWSRMLVIHF